MLDQQPKFFQEEVIFLKPSSGVVCLDQQVSSAWEIDLQPRLRKPTFPKDPGTSPAFSLIMALGRGGLGRKVGESQDWAREDL